MSLKTVGQILKADPGHLYEDYRVFITSQRWRKFSAEVRSQRGRYCSCCRRDIPTQLHHIDSSPELRYDRSNLVMLCNECHEKLTAALKQFRQFIFGWMTPNSFRVINGALSVAMKTREYTPDQFAYALAALAASPRSVKAFSEDALRTLVQSVSEPQPKVDP